MPHARSFQITRSLTYHVYNRGNARKEIFHAPKDYAKFIALLKKYSEEKGLYVYHWVMMPNHFHLLLEIKDPRRLSSIMAGIARAYCFYHHREYNSAGHLFQGRFRSKAIEKESYYSACGIYIERNPVRAGMVKRAEEYPYSSSKFYALGKDDGLTRESWYFRSLGSDIEERRRNYTQCLCSSDLMKGEFLTTDIPAGSADFGSRLIRENGRFVKRRGRPRKVATFSVNQLE